MNEHGIEIHGEFSSFDYARGCTNMRNAIGNKLDILRERPWATQAGEVTLDALGETGIAVSFPHVEGGKTALLFNQTSGELAVVGYDARDRVINERVVGDDAEGFAYLNGLHQAVFELDTASFREQQRPQPLIE